MEKCQSDALEFIGFIEFYKESSFQFVEKKEEKLMEILKLRDRTKI